MVVKVVDKSHSIMGYLLEGKFFSYNFIKSILKGRLNCDKTEFGVKSGNNIVVCDKYYNYSDYLLCLKSLSLNLDYKDISFVERIPTKDELNTLSSFWSSSNYNKHCLYTVIDNNINILGYFMTDKDIYVSLDCFLGMIEIKEKNRGIGSKVVSKLSNLVSLSGLSYIDSVKFWERNGAVFSRGYSFKIERKI